MSIKTWWWFRVKNPVIRQGEHGGFKWTFRRFWLDVETLSGNFKARFMAAEHPYAYLVSGQDDDNIEGFAEMLYTVGMLLTTDQEFVNDINEAFKKYNERKADMKVEEDETEEKMSLEEVKKVQEYAEMPEKKRKKVERDINGRFKKTVKKIETDEKKAH